MVQQLGGPSAALEAAKPQLAMALDLVGLRSYAPVGVLDADKIMVLEQGRLVEFGAPKELMARSGGRFRALVHAQPAE